MPIRIKPASSSQQKYVNNTGNAGQSYQDGINNPRRDWLAATTPAEGTWATSVQAAVSNGSFGKGINQDSAGNQKAKATPPRAAPYPSTPKHAARPGAALTQ